MWKSSWTLCSILPESPSVLRSWLLNCEVPRNWSASPEPSATLMLFILTQVRNGMPYRLRFVIVRKGKQLKRHNFNQLMFSPIFLEILFLFFVEDYSRQKIFRILNLINPHRQKDCKRNASRPGLENWWRKTHIQ